MQGKTHPDLNIVNPFVLTLRCDPVFPGNVGIGEGIVLLQSGKYGRCTPEFFFPFKVITPKKRACTPRRSIGAKSVLVHCEREWIIL